MFCIEARDFRDGSGTIAVRVHGDHAHCQHHDRQIGHASGYATLERAERAALRLARFLDHGHAGICDCALGL